MYPALEFPIEDDLLIKLAETVNKEIGLILAESFLNFCLFFIIIFEKFKFFGKIWQTKNLKKKRNNSKSTGLAFDVFFAAAFLFQYQSSVFGS